MSFLDDFYSGLEADQKKGGVQGKEACDEVLKKRCPCLHEFLSVLKVKGKPRQPGTLFIFTDQGGFKACLTDKLTEMTLWQFQDTLAGVLDALEADLKGGDRGLWRLKREWKGKK